MGGRRAAPVWLLALTSVVVMTAAGCTSAPSRPQSDSGSAGPAGPVPIPAAAAAAAGPASGAGIADSPDGRSIRSAIVAFDASAGGPAADQQRLLQNLVAPGQRAGQQECRTSQTTLSFEPVYADLAPSPHWRPAEGTLPGTVYSLPILIRIFTGSRLTGTDLADLHVSVQDGRAMFSTLCVS